MQTFADITAARNAIMDFRADHGNDIPEDLRARFRELSASPSPVEQIVGVGEFIYANRDVMPDTAVALGAGLIAFASTNAWHGLLEDQRGDRIVGVFRHKIGEIQKAPAAPDALRQYLPQEQPTPLPPAAPGPEAAS